MTNCLATVPQLYFWLMSQIMLVYVIGVFLVCWLFRKHCQDPNLVDAENDQEEQFEKNIEKNADIEVGLVETKKAELPKTQETVPAAEKQDPKDLKIDVFKPANEKQPSEKPMTPTLRIEIPENNHKDAQGPLTTASEINDQIVGQET